MHLCICGGVQWEEIARARTIYGVHGFMSSNASRDQSLSNRSTSSDNGKSKSAAFHGASHAFSHTLSAPKPPSNTYSGINGAIAAASTVGTYGRRQGTSSVEGSPLYGESLAVPSPEDSSDSGVASIREITGRGSRFREQSPSQTAARLATSKTTSTRDGLAIPRHRFDLRELQTADGGTDITIASQFQNDRVSRRDTTSLVKLFESTQNVKMPTLATHSVHYHTKPLPKVSSPTPIKPTPISNNPAPVSLCAFPSISESSGGSLTDESGISQAGAVTAAAKPSAPLKETTARTGSLAVSPSVPEPLRTSQRSERSSPDGARISTSYLGPQVSGATKTSRTDFVQKVLNEAAAHLQADPHRLGNAAPLPRRSFTSSFVPSSQPSMSAPRPHFPSARSYDVGDASASTPSRPNRTTTRSSNGYVPKLTVDSLANAMVASSLASSRAPSPSKLPPQPPHHHYGKSYSLFHSHHSQEQISRTPSPAKGMRHTMREPQKSDDEGEPKRKKGHIVRKYPNKHREGDRRRYRNQVTERERKRYEGVFAANKGLLIASGIDSKITVLNVVVRDIWRRSHLPNEVLEEVWNLVDIRNNGKLGREEFVVGLWLIDSRLKGNKLPSKVSESLWASVKRLSGIKEPHHHRR